MKKDMKFPEGFLWGEKWDGVQNGGNHSVQGCLQFLEEIMTTCTGPVRTHFASTTGQPLFFHRKNSPPPCQQLCEYLEQSGDKVYSISKIQQQ